jgi:hypothetical protein
VKTTRTSLASGTEVRPHRGKRPVAAGLSLLLLLAFVSVTPAGVVYQQPPNPNGGTHQSAVWGENGSDWDQWVWDSFILPTTQTIREIQWRGGYFRGPVNVTQFEISIWPSIPANIEPDIIAGPLVRFVVPGNSNETSAGTVGGVPMFDYKFTLPAGFTAQAGTKYWVQIFAYQPGLPGWGFADATNGNFSHFRCISAAADKFYQTAPGDCAFTLLDQATVPVTIAVRSNPTSGGSVTGGGTFAPGTMVTVTATPASARTFVNWTEAGVIVSTAASYAFPADGHRTLVANFAGQGGGTFTITAIANPGVGGNVGGAGTFNPGELVDLDASPADGLQLVSWTENGEIVSTQARYQFPATRDRTLMANFTNPMQQYFIYLQANPTNGGDVWGTGTYAGGTQVWLYAVPYEGFHFVNWKQGNTVVSTQPEFLLTVVLTTGLTATFAPDPVITATAAPPQGGSVQGGGPYAPGSQVSLTASSAIGYIFTNWTESAAVVSTSQVYVFPASSNRSLVANFVALNHLITASASPPNGGEVFGAGVYGHGAPVTLTALTASGNYFVNWTLGEAVVSTEAAFSFEALADYALVAHFATAPELKIQSENAGVLVVSWPAGAGSWVLQETTDLTNATWSDSTRAITLSNGWWRVTASTAEGPHFFRLAQP